MNRLVRSGRLMIFFFATLGGAACLLAAAHSQDGEGVYETRAGEDVKFRAVELVIDTGEDRLAAWQVELIGTEGVTIVGIENGEHPAYAHEAPHYDPAAMMNSRIILAQFSLNEADKLPSGLTRLATLHMRVETGVEPQFDFILTAAAGTDGSAIDAAITLNLLPDDLNDSE